MRMSQFSHRRAARALGWATLIVFLQATGGNAQQWPQWRGAQRDGVASNFAPPTIWPQSLTQKWKVPVGGGYASPVVAGARIYLHTRRAEEESVSCLDLQTGKALWMKSYAAPFGKNQYAVKMGKGPNSTPLLYEGKLYTLGVTAILSCFDAKTGALKWRKDFSPYVDTSKLFCGTAMSPVAERGAVIVHVGDDRKGWIIAFDAQSGKERWRWEGDGPGYASPLVVELEGVRQLVTLTDKSVVGLAADSGNLLWKFPHPDEWNENIVTPVLYGKQIIVSGVRQGTRALTITRNQNLWSAAARWHNPKVTLYMSSPILDGDYLYGLSSQRKGQFFCLDARTGEVVWTTDGRAAANAALVDARIVFFALTNDAELIVASKSREGFLPLTKYTVADSPTWAYPIIWGKHILIKDEENLILWAVESATARQAAR